LSLLIDPGVATDYYAGWRTVTGPGPSSPLDEDGHQTWWPDAP